MTRTRTDPALLATAFIIEKLAAKIFLVDAAVRQELAYADSFSDHTPGAGDPASHPVPILSGDCVTLVPIDQDLDVWRPCGHTRPCTDHDTPVSLTPVERAADRRLQLNRDHDDFKAQCRLLVVAASDALQSADRLIGARLEHEKITECRDGQVGREGAIEWGDVTCMKPSVKGNLCQAHYSASRRWRDANGKKNHDIEDAA